MDLIGSFPGAFVATGHVVDEITQPVQLRRYKAALAAGYILEYDLTAQSEVDRFLHLESTERLGPGELSAITYALEQVADWRLMILVRSSEPCSM